jgi:hypothetical protein
MALMAQRPQELPDQVNYAQVEKDVEELNYNGLGKGSTFNEVSSGLTGSKTLPEI